MINKNTLLQDFIKSLYAGAAIGVGCITYLSLSAIGYPIIGAILFGFGLFTILVFQWKLYTGQIGYLPSNLPIILIGNLIGAAALGILIPFTKLIGLVPLAKTICTAKLKDTILSQFLLSVFCGMLMYIAVEGYKRTSNPLIVLLAITIFILCGFEHCIAATAYFAIAHQISLSVAFRILLMVVGNSIGSLFISLPQQKFLERNTK